MTKKRLATGNEGEDLAAEFLRKSGHRILERNVRTDVGELDLVAQKRGVLIFVEVKTRRSRAFGYPQEAVGPRKQRQILRAALWYLSSRGLREPLMRFDVISVTLGGDAPDIVHVVDAFDATHL